MLDEGSSASFVAAFFFAAPGVFLSIRLWRNAVILEQFRVVVRGVFWSRSIPGYRVVGVTEWRWLEWRTLRGGRRFTPLSALWLFGSAPQFVEARVEFSFAEIDRWARSDGQLGAPPGPPRHRLG